ncbi:MAG: hypothetical protein MI920_10895 [Kiloniellales bacterium]|nr:hypothetical protein [Kiloniellales bacterium]
MFSWFGGARKARTEPAASDGEAKAQGRVVEIGWILEADKATFVYDPPRPVSKKGKLPENVKAVGYCPAIIDHEKRLFEVPCPVDLHLRLGKTEQGQPTLINVAGKRSPVAAKVLKSMVHLMGQDRWRDPRRPVLQVSAPWRFLADEPAWMTQMPPFNHYRDPAWPGLQIGGRFPVHIWPRSLMWAFEWWDASKDLVLRRGEPWFYVRFETQDPSRPVRLVEAEMTEDLREYCNGLDSITNYVNQTYQLFTVAEERRPPKLLKKKERERAEAAE